MDIKQFYENKSVLVTGGTGTIGSEIVNQLLKYNPKVIRIFSNSENELWETKLRFKDHAHKLRFLLGDIRNFERVKRAMNEMDYVFNAAAIKHVPISEYNPMEAVTVNILGLNNVIEAAFYNNVKNLMHISTDKAVSPTTAMGATKMLGERICIAKSNAKGNKELIIACVRFGNVLGSRGSIIPLIKQQIQAGNEVTLTGKDMNRFFMSISQASNLVLKSMVLSQGGEIFVLKMPSIKIKDLIEVIIEEFAPKVNKSPENIKIKTLGARPGEKSDEKLISSIEYDTCYELDDLYLIYPIINFIEERKNPESYNGKKLKMDDIFIYSTKNQEPLSKDKIKTLLNELQLLD